MSPSLAEAGKPHVFLLDDPEREIAYYASHIRDPSIAQDLGEIINTTYEIVLTRSISESSSQVLLRGFESRSKPVWSLAGRRIVELSHYFDSPCELLLHLASHPKAHIRLRVVQSLFESRPPAKLSIKILRQALHDKSSRVRMFAVDRIGMFAFEELLPEMEKVLRTEENSAVQASLQLEIDVLKHGYHLNPNKLQDGFDIIVRTNDSLGGPFVPNNECTPDRIQELIEEYRSQHEGRT